MTTRPVDAARGVASFRLRSYAEFNEPATCPKCLISGWYPRLVVQWHPEGDPSDDRGCPPMEHLHALCPACNYPLFFLAADQPSAGWGASSH